MDRKAFVDGLDRMTEDKRRFEEADYPGVIDRVAARACRRVGIGYFQFLRAYAFLALPWARLTKWLKGGSS